MMYKTHKEIGKVFYFASLPLLINAGFLPEVAGTGIVQTGLSILSFGAATAVGYHGAIWGAGSPDLDCKGSTPDRRNPLLGKLLRSFGVEHRGRFSHSLDSITITFALLLILVRVGMTIAIKNSSFAQENLSELVQNLFINGGLINNLLQVWIVSAYVGAVSHLFGDMSTKSGVRIFNFLPPFRIVPNHKFFKTGDTSAWETFYRKLFKVLIPVSMLASLYFIVKG